MEFKETSYHEAHKFLLFVVDIHPARHAAWVVRISCDTEARYNNPGANYAGDHVHSIDKRRVRT